MRFFAFVFGIIFLFLGAASFSSPMTEEGYLFKIFKVNLPLNVLHIITGICAIWVAFLSSQACRLYFQIVGILYALIASLGFVYGSTHILGVFANNILNTWMHVITATIALVLGYGNDER